jgi:hypothetical protein
VGRLRNPSELRTLRPVAASIALPKEMNHALHRPIAHHMAQEHPKQRRWR